MTGWTMELAASAVRSLDRLPPRIVPAVVEFIYGPSAANTNPARVGKPLRGEYDGLHGARRGDYRILYELGAGDVVLVHRISHRSDAHRAGGR